MKDYWLIAIVVVLSVLVGMLIMRLLTKKKQTEEISTSVIEAKLSECSDLTTCRLEYVDLVKYSSGTIPFMTKKSFTMIYKANIRAGIDLSLAKAHVYPHKVVVSLPQTEIQSMEIDTDSLRFYDEHFALFNWTEKEDIATAMRLAKEDVEKNADLDTLAKQARQQAEIVVKQLVKQIAKDKEVVVE